MNSRHLSSFAQLRACVIIIISATLILVACTLTVSVLRAARLQGQISQAVQRAGGRYFYDSLKDIQQVVLTNTSDTDLQWLCQQPVIHEKAFGIISLRGSQITDVGIGCLRQCDRIEVLDVSHTAV